MRISDWSSDVCSSDLVARDCTVKKTQFSKLKMSAAPIVLGIALISAPAFAQDAPADDEDVTSVNDASVDDTIVVTGSLLRRTNNEAPSPVTVISAESLQERGINTVADGVQRLSDTGAGTIAQGWYHGWTGSAEGKGRVGRDG